MLTSEIKERVDIPHEPGDWIEVRPLSWFELQEAARARTKQVLGDFADYPKDFFESLDTRLAETPAKENDFGGEYDRFRILTSAVVAWSYQTKVSPEAIQSLDSRTADWLFSELISRSVIERAEGEDSRASSNGTTKATADGRQNS